METTSFEQDQARWCKPLLAEPDSDDLSLHAANARPELVSRRLRELVPLLEFVDCTVVSIERDCTVLTVPLAGAALNQNGTHQASVFYLLADYALGTAMFGAMPGVYVTGIHDRCAALPVQCWLKRGTVRHLAPGTGTLLAVARVSPEQAARMRQELREKGRCELQEAVRFYQDGALVAEAESVVGFYADLPREAGARVSALQAHQRNTSALMIAGLRPDALSRRAGGDQGAAIASRMALVAPQLPQLVAARSTDVERHLLPRAGAYEQVLVLGLGLDTKPVRLASPGTRWWGLDLPHGLEARSARFAAAGIQEAGLRLVAADLLQPGWTRALLAAGFDAARPTFIALEGVAMYLTPAQIVRVLDELRSLLLHPACRVWIDHVTPGMFALGTDDVRSFLATMTRLGEPFVSGFGDVAEAGCGSWCTESQSSAAHHTGSVDPVHHHYCFSLLAPHHLPRTA